MSRVVMILSDGMRPDGLEQCRHPFVNTLKSHSLYSLNAKTVSPSVTLPCHMSLIHSVTPQRHGILTNTYVPQVRPVKGIFEVVREQGKTAAFYYNWGELRDLYRPDSLARAQYISGHIYGWEKSNALLIQSACKELKQELFDFTFLYLAWTDEAGHASGWMSSEYLHAVYESVSGIKQMTESAPEDTIFLIISDHGGHDRTHGTELPEDMTIPFFLYRKGAPSRHIENASILDAAPTIASILGLKCDPDWEGRAIEL